MSVKTRVTRHNGRRAMIVVAAAGSAAPAGGVSFFRLSFSSAFLHFVGIPESSRNTRAVSLFVFANRRYTFARSIYKGEWNRAFWGILSQICKCESKGRMRIKFMSESTENYGTDARANSYSIRLSCNIVSAVCVYFTRWCAKLFE